MAIPIHFATLWANLPQWSDAELVTPPPAWVKCAVPNPPCDYMTTANEKEKCKGALFKRFPQIPNLLVQACWETCCVQMSHAFNKSGKKINYSNKRRVLRDPAGNEYMLDVKEMRGYLESEYGKPETFARRDAGGKVMPRWLLQSVLDGRQGVIAFGGRHIDLWNGRKIHGENYIDGALWEASSALSDGLFFWGVEGPPPATP